MPSKEYSKEAVRTMCDLLDYCKTRSVYVVGMLNPYPEQVLKRLKTGEDFAYIWSFPRDLETAFRVARLPSVRLS
jgi:hypothetical protein